MAQNPLQAMVRPSHYLRFFDALNRNGIRYMVIGGVAMNLHGISRATLDIDIVVDAGWDQSEAWEVLCQELGIYPLNQPRFKEMYDPEKRRGFREEKNLIAYVLVAEVEPHPKIDVMFDPPWEFRHAYGRRLEKVLQGVKIPYVGESDLIAMKEFAGREKDLADIALLKRKGT